MRDVQAGEEDLTASALGSELGIVQHLHVEVEDLANGYETLRQYLREEDAGGPHVARDQSVVGELDLVQQSAVVILGWHEARYLTPDLLCVHVLLGDDHRRPEALDQRGDDDPFGANRLLPVCDVERL